MFQFIYWLKAIAAVLITNSHYYDIWPIPALAHGGHLGNCLFFLVSGFCLYHIREPFLKWYGKRIVRIYPTYWIVAAVDLLAKRIYIRSISDAFQCLIFPTWHHFVGSIMVLYVVFYGIRRIQEKWKISMERILIFLILAFAGCYLLCFDKSYYHIDKVTENWVRWQFLLSMLAGAVFREKYQQIGERIGRLHGASVLLFVAAYFLCKVTVSRGMIPAVYQFLVPASLVCSVVSLATLFLKLEKKGFFAAVPEFCAKPVRFVAGITLEISLGQLLILERFSRLPFPVDFFVVTSLILVYAWFVHKLSVMAGNVLRKPFKL